MYCVLCIVYQCHREKYGPARDPNVENVYAVNAIDFHNRGTLVTGGSNGTGSIYRCVVDVY
jgi:hypothetical protein